VTLQVFGDDQRRQIVADGQCGADRQRAERAAGQVAFDIAAAGQQFLGLRQQAAAGGVEMQRLADTVEQRAVELPLQFDQGAAGRRLRHRQGFGGARDVFATRDGGKDFELAQGDFHINLVDNV